MTFMKKPQIAHLEMPKNALGLTRRDYEGVNSTLCAFFSSSISTLIVRLFGVLNATRP